MSQIQPPPSKDDKAEASAAGEASPANAKSRDIALQELTVAELIGLLLKKPAATLRCLRSATGAGTSAALPASWTQPAGRAERGGESQRSYEWLLKPKYLQLLLCAAAISFAWIGSVYARGTPDIPRANYFSFEYAAPYLWAGFLLWLLAEVIGNREQLRDGWLALDLPGRLRWLARVVPALLWINAAFLLATSLNAPAEQSVGMALHAGLRFVAGGAIWLLINLSYWWHHGRMAAGLVASSPIETHSLITERKAMRPPIWREITPLRKLMVVTASAGSLFVWVNSTGNYIPLDAIKVWLGTALLWCFVFAPLRWNVLDWASDAIDQLRRIRWRKYRWAIFIFALVMILAFSFRYDMLDQYPRYMYGDLVEKVQDAYSIYYLDDYRIFMQNIGGREPLHFYLLSILASQEGMNFDHFALKSMTALWSILSLPLMFWFAVEVFAELKRDRKWAIIVALAMLGLVAGSFWHAMLGRQGLRTGATSFWTPAIMIFFVRALRSNRRSHFVLAGLCLGFGLISYQAMRMMPASIVAGLLVTLLVRRFSWRERASYLLNLAVLAGIAFTVFMPLMRYWIEYPDEYLQRASTRMFGDMPTSPEERTDFLLESGALFLKNWHDQFLMYHYNGEATFISSAPDEPHFDPVSAAFMTLGVAAWIVLMAKTRDPFVWYVPVFLFFAMLPSALALSFSIEVPSLTRGNTAITPSYLIAALPLAVFCRQLYRCLPRTLGILAGFGFGALVILAANEYNTNYYFGYFTDNFNRSSHPYVEAGAVLRGFVESDGAYGNAFVAAMPHWWDHRAVGIESGIMFFENGAFIWDLPHLIGRNFMRRDEWQLIPERDLLIFYAMHDSEAPILLEEWFPQGRSLFIETHHPQRGFYVYRVPALGQQGLQNFVDEHA